MEARRQERERFVRENPAYSNLGDDDCGKVELAGKSIAVPFVGTTAASLVVAEAIRMLHDGPAYTDIKLRLAAPRALTVNTSSDYTGADTAALKYLAATRLA